MASNFCECYKLKLSENKIDGKNIWGILTNESEENPHEALFFYYHTNSLHGVRYGDWKMYFPHRYRTLNGRNGRNDGNPIKYEYVDLNEIELYNLSKDPSETKNVYSKYPDIVKEIKNLANIKRTEIGDDLKNISGTENRPVGVIN